MSEFAPQNRVEPPVADPPPVDCRQDPSPETTGPAAIDRLMEDAAALRDHATLYLAARADQLKLSARRAAVGVVLGLLGVLVGATVLATAAVLTVSGIALGLAELFGQRLWLGQLVTGLAVLACCALGVYLWVRSMTLTSRSKTIIRYAKLHKRQLRRRKSADAQPTGSVGE